MNLLRIIAWKTPSQTAQRNSCKEVRKEPRDVRIFAGGKKTVSHQRLLPINKKQTTRMISVVFYAWEDASVWAHWNHSLDMHLNYLEQVPIFLPPESSSGPIFSGGFSGWWLDGGQRLLFTEMSGNIFLSTVSSGCFNLDRKTSPRRGRSHSHVAKNITTLV